METRCYPLLGEKAVEKYKKSHICIFGIGGVGGFVCEALARCGIGEFTIVDMDIVNETNINRQIIALNSTINKKKVDVMKTRLLDINPNIKVNSYDIKVDSDTINQFDFSEFDYVVDCVDDVKAKLLIISKAKENNKMIISSMGTGNKLDPSKFQIKDISKTEVCPLAKKVRLELRKKGIKGVKALFSTEEPIKSEDFVASVSFVPSIAGLLIAREVILDLKSLNN